MTVLGAHNRINCQDCGNLEDMIVDFAADLTPQLKGKVTVLLDGEDVTQSCFMGKEGATGAVALYRLKDGKRFVCDAPRSPDAYREQHAAYEIRSGEVKVVPK